VHLFAQNVEFIENRGQWDGPFKYKAITGKGDIYLEAKCFTYVLADPANEEKVEAYHHGQVNDSTVLNFHAYKVAFEGCNMPLIVGSKAQKSYYNYFLGNDPTRWKSGIHPYYDVDYKRLYNGIDMHLSSEKGNVEYEFDVQPEADVTQIVMSYNGVKSLRLRDKDLYISTSVGDVMEMKPYAYQYIKDEKVDVKCKYKLTDNAVTFEFPDGYDHSQTLVIDPTIVFCTFTGSLADNWGFTATYDAQGNFYAGGIVHGTGYPVSTGAYQTTYRGGWTYDDTTGSPANNYVLTATAHGSGYSDDIGIIKFDPTGANRIYATYLGGSDNEQPHSLIVDPSGNLIIAGRSYSTDFPTTTGAYSTTAHGGADIIITKLNATGTGLIGSTYIGGSGDDVVNYSPNEYQFGNLKHNYGDDARSEVQIDRQGDIYMAASTKSIDFPTVNAFISFRQSSQDAVIIKLNSTLTTLLWSTYFGGNGDDAAYALAFDTSQASIYVAGGTQSTNMPTTATAYHVANQGGSADGWITKFQNSGTYTMQKSTYIGTSGYDQVFGLQVDASNNVYAMGQTLGAFPVSAGVYSNPGSSQFIIRLDSNLTTNQLSTVYGTGTTASTNISPVAFLVDTCGNIYISGWGGNLGLGLYGGNPPASAGTTNMPITANAAQSTTDGNDFYFICLSKNMASLLYGTFFGSNNIDPAKGEHVDGGTSRFDKNGIIYEAICGGCAGNLNVSPKSPFPTTAGSWSPTDQAQPTIVNGQVDPANCNEVALKIAFQFGPVSAQATPTPTSGSGCAPLFVQFANNSSNGATYVWDFGDGSPTSTAFAPSHTYTTAGHYTLKLIASNSNACTKLVDTAYVSITVDTGSVLPAFTITKIDSCGPYVIHINNTSQHGTATATYTWDYGDGTNFTGSNPPNHTYSPAGTYTITLTMTDTSQCTSTGTATQTLTFSAPVAAAAAALPSTKGCVPFAVQFQNNSTNGITYQWSFGDGSPVNTTNAPSHTFNAAGSYTVRLISTNVNSCNKQDTAYLTIVVGTNQITPKFGEVQPNSCSPYVAIFTDSTVGTAFTVYTWFFGDGSSYTGYTPPAHTYAAAGNYTVLLTLSDSTTCNAKDTLAKIIKFNGLRVSAGFTSNDTVCIGTQATFTNTATNGAIYTYYFSNGQSTSGSATSTNYQFPDTGSYTIIQVVLNSAACNGADTFKRSIYVTAGPVADFSFTPVIPVTNTPVSYTNLSTGAVRYNWDFGDNTSSTDVNPTHMFKRTGDYSTCLTAYNTLSCPSKLCKLVSADIQPLADLPTGFSPNGDGANEVLYVRGAAIQTMDLMVFNRWGQMVFETTDQAKGWDGTYNGKPQEMDSYAYVLRVTFIDGTTLQKKGNVTLLR